MLSFKHAKILEKVIEIVDWKKLNRKATFTMMHKGRPFEIHETLEGMLQTTQDNLAHTETKESDTEALYPKLKGAKEDERYATESAAQVMAKETAARNEALAESNEERDALTVQKTKDEKFIEQTEEVHSQKIGEWKERKRLRTVEFIANLNKKIADAHQGNYFMEMEETGRPGACSDEAAPVPSPGPDSYLFQKVRSSGDGRVWRYPPSPWDLFNHHCIGGQNREHGGTTTPALRSNYIQHQKDTKDTSRPIGWTRSPRSTEPDDFDYDDDDAPSKANPPSNRQCTFA
jgi:hypothetical protein